MITCYTITYIKKNGMRSVEKMLNLILMGKQNPEVLKN